MSAKILIVDDSEVARKELRSLLESKVYQFVECENGKLGLEAFKSDPDIALVLTDVNMPVMGGLEMCEGIQELNRPKVPIIVISSGCSQELKDQGKNAGVTAWIVKPIDGDIFVQGIESLLSQ